MKKETGYRITVRGVIGCFFAGTGGPVFAGPRTRPEFRPGKTCGRKCRYQGAARRSGRAPENRAGTARQIRTGTTSS